MNPPPTTPNYTLLSKYPHFNKSSGIPNILLWLFYEKEELKIFSLRRNKEKVFTAEN